eukprot:scaffold40290_cov42-Prasinocladus_malaysianus.AAC.1
MGLSYCSIWRSISLLALASLCCLYAFVIRISAMNIIDEELARVHLEDEKQAGVLRINSSTHFKIISMHQITA